MIRAFLSYSGKDRDHVAEFRNHLAVFENGGTLKVWIDSEKILPGDDWKQRLDAALEKTDLLFAVLSPDYFRSEWCETEAEAARLKHIPIIPILLRPCGYQHSQFGKLDVTPDKGKKAVLAYPERQRDDIWSSKVIADIAKTLPGIAERWPSSKPPHSNQQPQPPH